MLKVERIEELIRTVEEGIDVFFFVDKDIDDLLAILREYKKMKAGEGQSGVKSINSQDATPSPGQLSAEDGKALRDIECALAPFGIGPVSRAAIAHLRARLSEHPAAPQAEDDPTMAKISPPDIKPPAWDPFLTPPQAEVTEERKAMLEFIDRQIRWREKFSILYAGQDFPDVNKVREEIPLLKGLKPLILAQPAPVRVSREQLIELADDVLSRWQKPMEAVKIIGERLRELGIVVEPEREG